METTELLSKLRTRGVALYPDRGRLRYEAPRGALTPELRAAVAERRRELVTLLAGERLNHAECMSAIADAFSSVTDWYVEGALAVLDEEPELARRFRSTEREIDQLALSGASEADFRAALRAHVATIRECCERLLARREAKDVYG